MTLVIVHGAGSTGAAAAHLLGAGDDAVLVEDRSGDIDLVLETLRATLADLGDCSILVGVSLGAHAVARWASAATRPLPRLLCVLPAWTDRPGGSAEATAAAARGITSEGIGGTLDRLAAGEDHPDVVQLLRIAWPDYSDDSLAHSLSRASSGSAPSRDQLAAIPAPVALVGWEGDAFHPASVAREWGRHLRWPTVAMAARPDIRLIRQAVATCGGLR
jgi:hypothetical protein